MLSTLLLATLAALQPLAPLADDLSDVYPSTRTWSKSGLFPVCTADDVWELKSFEIEKGKDLILLGKKATVAFGHDRTDVLWAVILPDKPCAISGTDAAPNESAKSILLRFAPSEIGRVFPAKTVAGPGDPWRRHEAQRIARQKMVWKWCTPAGNPTIVPAGNTIIDVDTVEGPRRVWWMDRSSGSLEANSDFEEQPIAPGTPIKARDAKRELDQVWDAFDETYANFKGLPKSFDWKRARKDAEKLLKHVETTDDLGAVVSDMVEKLEDLHAWVRVGDQWIAGFQRERALNANYEATIANLTKSNQAGRDLVWGATKDDIGYLGVHGLRDKDLPNHVDAALAKLKNTKALIVDLRFNGGGDELLGRKIAGRFLDESRVYGWNRYRSGPKHSALGPTLERSFEPRGPWRYDKPVICLMGRKTLSSAESLAMMFAKCPDVTTMGSPTGGSSGNPRPIQLDSGVTVNMPTWHDMLEDGTPLERRGFAPAVALEHTAEEFSLESDPVMAAALARLR